MNNFEKLSFNYNKKVNNPTNRHVENKQKGVFLHNMKHNHYASVAKNFYAKNYKFLIDLCNTDFVASQVDYQMYEKWLGGNGNKRN